MGIFEGFVFAFGDGHQDDALVFAEIKERGADEISDIFDKEQGFVLEGELGESCPDHLGFKMAAFACVDLDGGSSCCADRFGIQRSGLIAFDDSARCADLAQCTFEQASLPRPGRTHQIQRKHTPPCKKSPISLRDPLVFIKHALLQKMKIQNFGHSGF